MLSIDLSGESGKSEVTLQAGLQQSIAMFVAGQYGDAFVAFNELERIFGREQEYLKESVQSVVLPMRGYAALGIGQSEAAEEHLSAYLRQYGTRHGASQLKVLVLFSLAQAQEKNGRYSEAIDTYLQFCNDYYATPEAGFAHLRLGDLYKQVNKREASLEVLDRLYASSQAYSLRKEGRLRALNTAVEGDDLERAVEYLLKTDWQLSTMQEPGVLAFMALRVGDLLFSAERFEEALDAYRIVPEHSRLLERQKEVLEQTQARVFRGQRNTLSGAAGIWDEYYRTLIQRMGQMVAQLESSDDYTGGLYLRRGQASLATGKLHEAWILFREIAEGDTFDDLTREEGYYRWLITAQELRKWDHCLQISTTFINAYPASPKAPLALYLMANAYQELGEHDKAITLLTQLMVTYEDHPFRGRWQFSRGFNYLLLTNHTAARRDFRDYFESYGETALATNAAYWHALSWYFDKEYGSALEELDALLEVTDPDHHMRGEMAYRRATVLYALRDFEATLAQLEVYLGAFPDHSSRAEAAVLKGDALMGVGRLLEASIVFRQIGPEAGRLFPYAVFQAGKIFRALEEYDLMVRHFSGYAQREDLASHPRVSEALYWVGWAREQQGRPEEAVPVFETALLRYGNDPGATEIPLLLDGFRRLYRKLRPSSTVQLQQNFEGWMGARMEEAIQSKSWTWYSRLMLYSAELLEQNKQLAEAEALLAELHQSGFMNHHDAKGLARIGTYLLNREPIESIDYFKAILERYPLSEERGNSYFGLGLLAYEQKDFETASHWFHRILQELPGHPLGVEGALNYGRSELQAGRGLAAIPYLDDLLRMRHARGRPHAEALLLIGFITEEAGLSREAIAYYQRVYNMYRAYPDLVGEAYLRSARLFEENGDITAAWRTYREILYFSELTDSDVQEWAKKQFFRLEPLLPKEQLEQIELREEGSVKEERIRAGGEA